MRQKRKRLAFSLALLVSVCVATPSLAVTVDGSIFAAGFGGPAGESYVYKFDASDGTLLGTATLPDDGTYGILKSSDNKVYAATGNENPLGGAFDAAIYEIDPDTMAHTLYVSSMSQIYDDTGGAGGGATISGTPWGWSGTGDGNSFIANSFFSGGMYEFTESGGSWSGVELWPGAGVGGEGGNLNTPLDGIAGTSPFRNPGDNNIYFSHGGPGGHVKAIDATTGAFQTSFASGNTGIAENRFGPDINNDGINDLYVLTRDGSGFVRVYSGAPGFALLDADYVPKPSAYVGGNMSPFGLIWVAGEAGLTPDLLYFNSNSNDSMWVWDGSGRPQYMNGWDAPLGLMFMSNEASVFNPADFNQDNKVDPADFAILAGNWLMPGGQHQGDANGDGFVDPADFAIMAGNWLFGVGGAAGLGAVPEPSTILLVVMGLASVAFYYRRRFWN